MKVLNGIRFQDVMIMDSVWSERIETVIKKTIPTCIRKCHETGRIKNFMVKGKVCIGEYCGHSYNDSDVYKVIEAAAYSLSVERNSSLEDETDAIIGYIIKAQEKCGYLNTKYSADECTSFTDFNEHEMYNCGHLIEAGIAYYEATGKDALLNSGIRFVDYLMELFGPEKRIWLPGHQEIELALTKLGEITLDMKYLVFAKWLLDQRGGIHEEIDKDRKIDREYCQDLENPVNLKTIYGHSVRAMYMLAAMARMTRYSVADYRDSLLSVWKDITEKKMYITGGIGSSSKNEGFSDDYFLPNEDAYCETCAAVGMVYYNYEMFLLTADSKYIDIIERELYNNVLSGISLDGDKFFYRNVLESSGSVARKEWYKTACCPTQLARFIPTIGKYIFARSCDILYVNLFISSEFRDSGTIKVESEYPYSGKVKIGGKGLRGINELKIRIPYWAMEAILTGVKNAEPQGIQNGYFGFFVKDDFSLELNFTMRQEKIRTNEMVLSNQGKVALQYGPLIYCMEKIDNIAFESFTFGEDDLFVLAGLPEGLGYGKAIRITNRDSGNIEAELIPYYLWNNRDCSAMKIFLPEKSHCKLYFGG